MQAVTVVFDEILHVHRVGETRSSPEHTVFSFMSNFKYTPYVTVPGSPRLEPGTRVKALLREPDNWKSLVGWRDLKTGELSARSPTWHLHRLLFVNVWFVFAAALMGRVVVQLQLPQALLWLPFASLWAVCSRIEYKSWRQVQRDLKALQSLTTTNEI